MICGAWLGLKGSAPLDGVGSIGLPNWPGSSRFI
uniref:Uncharacterized protein n=1 Tax=Arundo donax TaxID=35708 RepID=A0A0A9A9E5_ARUDO